MTTTYLARPAYQNLVDALIEAAAANMPDFAPIIDRDRVMIALGVVGDIWIKGSRNKLPSKSHIIGTQMSKSKKRMANGKKLGRL